MAILLGYTKAMNSKYSIVRVLPVILMLLNPLQSALADDDYIEARLLLESGEILPLEVILKNVRQAFPGKILELELEKEDSEIVYEMEILGDDGVIREVYIDARSGEILSAKEDD